MPLLREFKALTQSAGASLFAYSCELTNMDGTLFSNVTAVPLYFQIFDKASAPVANDIPIKSFAILAGGPFPLVSVFQNMGPIEFALGFAVGISSAHEKYTAATAVYDVFGEIIEGYQSTDSVPGLTTTGDLTTPTTGNVFWTDGDSSNNKRLYRVRAKNLSAGTRYLQLFAADPGSVHPTNGDIPISQWIIAAGVTIALYFHGLRPRQFFTSLGVIYGCSLALSSTPGVLTVVVANDLALEAQFKVDSSS